MTTFRILRTDYQADPSLLLGEGLLIGRDAVCELQLNHPSVQSFHAGIILLEGASWISALAEPSPLLNGEPFKHAPLADGDALQCGAYRLHCSISQEARQITVEFSLASEPASDAITTSTTEATPTTAAALSNYWAQRLQAAAAAQTAPRTNAGFAWEPTSDLRRRWPWSVAAGGLLGTVVLAGFAALAYPRAFAPAALSAPHARHIVTSLPALAARASNSSCTSCHSLLGSMQKNCASCHTTPAFQAGIGNTHLLLGINCLTCHAEHRGGNFQPALVANDTCTNCHRADSSAPAAEHKSSSSPHQVPVRYPVKNGLWSWDGLSQADWQRRGLPGRTADYNLREQFHMLHTQGQPQGRAQCGDCHLGGTEGKQLWHSVRESCAQCHRLQPALAAELAELAASNALVQGNVRCVACHAQHGAEKDLRTSARK